MTKRVGIFLLLAVMSFKLIAQSKKKDVLVSIMTNLGTIEVVLFDQTPLHKANFLKLAKEGYYDSTTFHRVLKDFMIQGGDPNSKPNGDQARIGMGSPGYTIAAEFVADFQHHKGMLAAARQGDQINPERRSSGSQFYIVQNQNGAHHLDNQYTIFGQVVKGIEVVDKIADQEVDRMGRPAQNIRMAMKLKKMKCKKITLLYGYQYKTN